MSMHISKSENVTGLYYVRDEHGSIQASISFGTGRSDELGQDQQAWLDLIAAAPDLLSALRGMMSRFEHTGEAWMSDPAWLAGHAAIAKATSAAPAGWTHAETYAPDDPTIDQRAALIAAAAAVSKTLESDCASIYTADDPTQQGEVSFPVKVNPKMTLPELLAAILRRAERAKTYGRLMLTSKDLCIDDVVRLAERALLQVNDALPHLERAANLARSRAEDINPLASAASRQRNEAAVNATYALIGVKP